MRPTTTFLPPIVSALRGARIKAAAAAADINSRRRDGDPAVASIGEGSAAGDGEQGREL